MITELTGAGAAPLFRAESAATMSGAGAASTLHAVRRSGGALLLSTLLCAALLPAPTRAQDAPRTGAELAEFERHTSHDELMSFLYDVQARSDRMLIRHIAKTAEGRDLPLVILGAPPAASPATAFFSGRPTVFFTGNVHGGERAGREGTLQLIRELAIGSARPLLDRVNVLIVPSLNPDGAEERRRTNALGYDMNRDFIVAETPEIAAILEEVLLEWWPDVYVDVHNGGAYPYNLTYQATLHPAADSALVAFARGPMFEAVRGHMQSRDMRLYWYSGPRRDADTGEWSWQTTAPWARKQHSYGGLQNMITLLYEIPGRWTLREQADNAREGMLGLLEFVADNATAVRGTVTAARARTLHDPPQHVVVSVEQSAYPKAEQFYVMEEDEPRLVTGANRTLYVATETRPRPWAYAFDARLNDLADFLRRHDIQVERLRTPAQVSAEKFRLTDIEWAEAPYQNHLNATPTVELVAEQMTLPEGTYLVRMTQNAARLIPELMEPDTDDSVVVWNLLDHPI
ncbi:MAG: M14 family zinc carboxypeptidase, partial [Longimicrobiales bacterium]